MSNEIRGIVSVGGTILSSAPIEKRGLRGIGIRSIELTGTVATDKKVTRTYTITFDDGDTFSYDVVSVNEEYAESVIEGAEAAQTASESARDISISAKNDAVSAKNDAQTARTGSEAARDTAISAKNDAVSAKNDAETAQGLAEDARDDAESARDTIQDSIEGCSQEVTQLSVEEKVAHITELLEYIVEHGTSGSLNGFELNMDSETQSVILSYTDPDTGDIYEPAYMPTEETGEAIVHTLKDIARSLKIIVEGENQ